MKKDLRKKNGKGDGFEETVVGANPSDGTAISKKNSGKVVSGTEFGHDVQSRGGSPDQGASAPADGEHVTYPMDELFSYVGSDSTAVNEIMIIDEGQTPGSEDMVAAKGWQQDVAKTKTPSEESLSQGVEVLKNLVAATNKDLNIAQRTHAERAIAIGIICISLKKTLKQLHPDILWDVWATKHLLFLGERNRQKFMRIARRQDSYRFTFLGVDRLDMLITATQDLKKQKDPIGSLLKKYNIEFDEKSDMEIGEFKRKIDAAIAAERLEDKGLNMDFQLIKDVVNVNGKIDKALIKTLQDVKKYGGDPAKPLEDLVLTGGKKQGTSPDQRPLDFNKLSADLIKTIDYLLNEPDYIDKLDEGLFDDLMKSLQRLKKLRQSGNITAKAA